MNVIFFDGYCGLCNGFVDFMMRVDKKAIFKFSPLQSEFAKQHVKPEDISDLKSVVILIEGKTYRKAEGVLKAISLLGGIWKGSSLLSLLPNKILNVGYDLVAENRYSLFGKRETCRLPSPEERSRFIL
jgi:predicted DCC family thiol-disulfide oxidoreductase YuxK